MRSANHMLLYCLWLASCSFSLTATCVSQDAAKEDVDEPRGVFSGKLVDTDSNPVTDAELTLYGAGYFQTQTDDRGEFHFLDAIPAGEYRLRIESTSWVGITDYDLLPQILIDPDKPSQKEFVLQRACQIELTVVDEDGKPVQGQVYYRPVNEDRFRNAEYKVTNAEGKATIGGLSRDDARFEIGVHSDSHAFGHLFVDVSDPDKIVKQQIVLEGGQPIKGTAVCSDGEPPTGWMIYALPTWWQFGSYPSGVQIDDDGGFEFPHITGEPYDFILMIPMGDGMSTSQVVLSNANLLQLPQPIPVKIDHPSPKSMNYLTGTIRWIGEPISSAIMISGYSAELKHHISHHLEAGSKEFKIGPIPTGTYRIRVDSPELETINLRKIKNLNDLDRVKIPNDEPLQLVLRVRGKPHVQGRVVDAATQKAIESFRYRITKTATLDGPNYVQEDNWRLGKSGEFRSDVVGPGIYSISILADGYAIETGPQINTDEQADEVMTYELRPGINLRGKVVDAVGKGVEGATVRALSLAAGSMPRVLDRFVTMEGATTTLEDGSFELKNLRPGVESLRVDHPGYAFKVVDKVEVPSKAGEPLTLELTSGATLRGKIYDADGKPQPYKTLLFHDDYAYGGGDREAGMFGKATSDAEGNYNIEHLPETVVYVSRTEVWDELGVVRHAVCTQDGTTHQLDFGGTTQLSGRLFINGLPQQNARLQLGGDDSAFGAMKMYAMTDDDGSFVFHGAPSGHWTLYRPLEGSRSEWSAIRDIDVPAAGNVELGEIRLRVGTLRVRCKPSQGALPESLQLTIRQYSPYYYFGRDAATQVPRADVNDPFEFSELAAGDLELASYDDRGVSIVQRLKVTEDLLESTIDFEVPIGNETLHLEIKDDEGKANANTLMLKSEDERLIAYLQPAQDSGKCSIANLPAGNYRLHEGNIRQAPVVATLNVVAGAENRYKVQLPANSSSAFGMAVLQPHDENGVYLPCHINITGNNQDTNELIVQPSNGAAVYLSGKPGTYVVRLEHPGFQSAIQEIELQPVSPASRREVPALRIKLARQEH